MVEVGDGDSLVLSFLLSHSFQIVFKEHVLLLQGLPRWLRGKESACGRCGFGPWVGKTPWRRKWQTTPVFLPMDRGAWRATIPGVAKSQDTTEETEQKHNGIYNEENK